jgi:hypothetical protein
MPTKPQAEQSKTHRQASTSDGQRAEEAHEDAPPSSAQGGNSGDAPQPSCGQKRSNSRQRKRKRERDAEQSERP